MIKGAGDDEIISSSEARARERDSMAVIIPFWHMLGTIARQSPWRITSLMKAYYLTSDEIPYDTAAAINRISPDDYPTKISFSALFR